MDEQKFKFDEIVLLRRKNDNGNGDGCNMCRLKYARMAVEAEMKQ